MIFHHQAIGNRIRRKGIQPRCVPASLQHQPAIGVIAADAANRVDERLVVKLQRVHPSGTVHVWFVCRGKEQMVVVTGKGGGDLCPVGVHLCVAGWIDHCPNVVFQPAVVPVIIDHDIHSRSDGPVNRLFDLRHIGRIDQVIGGVGGDVGGGGHVPCAWDANGVEPVLDGRVEHRHVWRPPVQLQRIPNIHSVGRIRPRHGGGDIGGRRLQAEVKYRVILVAAAGGAGAAGDRNDRDFTAGVGVRGHGQRRPTAAGRLNAERKRVRFVRCQQHIQPAPLQPITIDETRIGRAERDEQRRRAVAHRVDAEIIRRRARRRAVTVAGIQSRCFDGDRHELHCVGSGGEGLTDGRVVVGEIIQPVGPGLVAARGQLKNIICPRTRRGVDIRKSLGA